MQNTRRKEAPAQEDAFTHDHGVSLKYVLCLNGVVLHDPALDAKNSLVMSLVRIAPTAVPGATGPISVCLVL